MHPLALCVVLALAVVLTGCSGSEPPAAGPTASPAGTPDTGLDPALPPVPSLPPLPSAPPVVPPGVPFAGNLLVAADQAGSGRSVTVVQAASGEPGGLIVVRADSAGPDGAVLGSVPVPAGPGRTYEVPLARPLPRSTALRVALHRDADGDGRYDPDGDDPVVTPNGPLVVLVRYTLER